MSIGRRVRVLVIVAVLGIGSVAATLAAATMARPEPAVLRHALMVGEERSYSLHAETQQLTSPPGDARSQPTRTGIEATLRRSVADIDETGVARVELVLFDGQEADGGPGGTQRMWVRVDPDGEVAATDSMIGFPISAGLPAPLIAHGGTGIAGIGVQPLFARLPAGPVLPGDEWSSSVNVPLTLGGHGATATTTVRFEDYEQTPAGPAARLSARTVLPVEIRGAAFELFGTPPASPDHPMSSRMRLHGLLAIHSHMVVTIDDGDILESDVTLRSRLQLSAEQPDVPAPTEYTTRATTTVRLVRLDGAGD